jgi:CRP-like cAMP-binding protein
MIKRAVRDCGDCELLVRGLCVFGPKKLAADSVITLQDSVAEEVSFVRKGVVALTVLTSEGDQAHVAVRGPRSLLGLESLRELPSPAEVTAVSDVELCVAPAERVRSWVGPESGARRMFELTISELLDQRRDVDFRSGSADARVARFLIVCAEHMGRGRGAAFSKMRAASVLGLRPETLSRVLRRLLERGVIETTPVLKILDAEALSVIAAD